MRKCVCPWMPGILTALALLMLLTGCAGVKEVVNGMPSSAGETAVSPTEIRDGTPAPVTALRSAAKEAARKTDENPSRRTAAVVPRRKGYGIVVYKGSQSVAVYSADAQGKFTVPVKIFTCSTGNPLSRTPDGTYRIRAKYRWRLLVGGVYGQYGSSISRSYLFHSVPYLKQDASTLENEEYDRLGSPASKGCIRMCVRDCKWIYDNCPIGTEVRIVSESGPFGPGVPLRLQRVGSLRPLGGRQSLFQRPCRDDHDHRACRDHRAYRDRRGRRDGQYNRGGDRHNGRFRRADGAFLRSAYRDDFRFGRGQSVKNADLTGKEVRAMRHLMVKLKYDGRDFCGWQVQEGLRTVQAVFQETLWEILGEKTPIRGCSRTDSGVHANEFCVSFATSCAIPADRLPLALNVKLPPDIAAFACREVPEGFHARYDCRGKQYRYLILNAPARDPFWHARALWYKYPLDAAFLDTQAQDYLGTHDFSAFCSAGSDVQDKVRTVTQCGVRRMEHLPEMVEFTVTADGFLYNMVRIMVGTLLKMSAGRLAPDSIPEIIASRDRQRAGFTAAACGLYLNRVLYSLEECDIMGADSSAGSV